MFGWPVGLFFLFFPRWCDINYCNFHRTLSTTCLTFTTTTHILLTCLCITQKIRKSCFTVGEVTVQLFHGSLCLDLLGERRRRRLTSISFHLRASVTNFSSSASSCASLLSRLHPDVGLLLNHGPPSSLLSLLRLHLFVGQQQPDWRMYIRQPAPPRGSGSRVLHVLHLWARG